MRQSRPKPRLRKPALFRLQRITTMPAEPQDAELIGVEIVEEGYAALYMGRARAEIPTCFDDAHVTAALLLARHVRLDRENGSAWYKLGVKLRGAQYQTRPVEILKAAKFELPDLPEQPLAAQVQCFARAVRHDPEASLAWQSLGTTLLVVRRAERIVEINELVKAELPRLHDDVLLAASECLWRAVKLDPKNVTCWGDLGVCLGEARKAGRSVEIHQVVQKELPSVTEDPLMAEVRCLARAATNPGLESAGYWFHLGVSIGIAEEAGRGIQANQVARSELPELPASGAIAAFARAVALGDLQPLLGRFLEASIMSDQGVRSGSVTAANWGLELEGGAEPRVVALALRLLPCSTVAQEALASSAQPIVAAAYGWLHEGLGRALMLLQAQEAALTRAAEQLGDRSRTLLLPRPNELGEIEQKLITEETIPPLTFWWWCQIGRLRFGKSQRAFAETTDLLDTCIGDDSAGWDDVSKVVISSVDALRNDIGDEFAQLLLVRLQGMTLHAAASAFGLERSFIPGIPEHGLDSRCKTIVALTRSGSSMRVALDWFLQASDVQSEEQAHIAVQLLDELYSRKELDHAKLPGRLRRWLGLAGSSKEADRVATRCVALLVSGLEKALEWPIELQEHVWEIAHRRLRARPQIAWRHVVEQVVSNLARSAKEGYKARYGGAMQLIAGIHERLKERQPLSEAEIRHWGDRISSLEAPQAPPPSFASEPWFESLNDEVQRYLRVGELTRLRMAEPLGEYWVALLPLALALEASLWSCLQLVVEAVNTLARSHTDWLNEPRHAKRRPPNGHLSPTDFLQCQFYGVRATQQMISKSGPTLGGIEMVIRAGRASRDADAKQLQSLDRKSRGLAEGLSKAWLKISGAFFEGEPFEELINEFAKLRNASVHAGRKKKLNRAEFNRAHRVLFDESYGLLTRIGSIAARTAP